MSHELRPDLFPQGSIPQVLAEADALLKRVPPEEWYLLDDAGGQVVIYHVFIELLTALRSLPPVPMHEE